MGLALALAAVPAAAAEQTWQGQAVTNMMRFDAMAVGDVEGHQMALYEMRGALIQDDGTVGRLEVRGTVELDGPQGDYRGYVVVDYPDGARALGEVEGSFEIGSEAPVDRGTMIFTGGTGRLEGMSGEGRYEGRILAPLDQGGTTHYTWSAKVTLPD